MSKRTVIWLLIVVVVVLVILFGPFGAGGAIGDAFWAVIDFFRGFGSSFRRHRTGTTYLHLFGTLATPHQFMTQAVVVARVAFTSGLGR